tara:strand:- start:233 stop:493 length:261 start_codon:yes stop_codon:yes gene_type:complete
LAQKRQFLAAYNLSIGGVLQSFRIKPAETCLFWLFLAKICRLRSGSAAKRQLTGNVVPTQSATAVSRFIENGSDSALRGGEIGGKL